MTPPINKPEYLIIDKKLALKGNSLQFNNEKFFTLETGQYVTQIGDGRETGVYRTDFFVEPFLYMGSFEGVDDNGSVKYFAFQIPKSILSILPNNVPHFFLYESTGLEAMIRTKSYIRFFNPKFTLAEFGYKKQQIQEL